MMVVRRVNVAAVLAGLGLEGCCSNADTFASEDVALFEVEWGEYVGDDHVLSSIECETLCSERGGLDRVDGCSEPLREESDHWADSDTAGQYTVTCTGTRRLPCAPGRRPPGLGRLPRRNPEAAMEAASIHAFLRLHRELTAHGAPDSLARRCLAAARDEVRHAQLLSFDGRVPRVRVVRRPLRSLAAIARDNAVEGCVNETWAALVAHLDPRPVYRIIAADELRHAQLAWDIEAWLGVRARPDLRRKAGARLVAGTSGAMRGWAEAMRERLWA